VVAQATRRQRTAQAILDAAARLFDAAGGSAAATVDAIAREADVAVATVYDHFAGKEEIYVVLAERLVSANEAYLADATGSGTRGLESAVAIGAAYANFHLDHPLAFRLLGLSEAASGTSDAERAARRRVRKRIDAMIARLVQALDEAVSDGEIEPLDTRLAAVVMWASVNGVLAANARGSIARKDLPDALRLTRELALHGLRAGGR
jgi:AcrR family transcriptional regulator